jgi:predicted metalloendopeptidase
MATLTIAIASPGCSSTPPAHPHASIGAWGFDLTGLDLNVKPGDDFDAYANGSWEKRTEIPPDRTRWGSFNVLRAKSEEDLKTICEGALGAPRTPGSVEQKVADYYESYIDADAINAAGLAPAKADLDAIAGARTHDDVARLMGDSELELDSPVRVFPTVDDKDPDRYTVRVVQSGLGMPNRDYYLDKGAKYADTRAKYRAYVERMLSLVNYADANAAAEAIFKLETDIAQIHWPNEKRRNRDLTYNPKSRTELQAFAPDYPWSSTLDAAGLGAQDKFVVSESDAVQKLATLFHETPVQTWRAYLTFHYLDEFADVLPTTFEDASFEFNNKTLNGQQEKGPRWKRATHAVDGALGEAVGQIYVARYFPAESKAKMLELVENLRRAYRVRIGKLDWMSADTKTVAIRKLDTLRIKIGYPDKWRDYTALDVHAYDPVGNRKRARAFEWTRNVKRLNQPTERDEWRMSPPTVNAYYNPRFNEIVFPAAILQPPYFDPNADMAVNYGAIGGVIGHEMSHGYDDQGAKSDERGVLHTWWKEEDVTRFKALTERMAVQYDGYEALPGLHVNGKRTLGENIGDHGGLTAAYEAFELSKHGGRGETLDGFTPEQRVFLGWAQAFREVVRDDALRNQVVIDPHSPAKFRVNGVVVNVDAWYRAFNVQPGEKLYLDPKDRVHIW